MPLFELDDVKQMTGARVLSGESVGTHRSVRRVSTDSREVRPGDLFVALKGDRFDGHAFVGTALRRGAIAAIVEDQFRLPAEGAPRPLLLGVDDPLVAYQQLAASHRTRFDVPVVAVTGSNGKTTSKEMVARVLGERWRVLKTEANFNNRVGVPQTLLRLTARHEAAVIEIGVDAKGQTTQLAEIVRPTIGLITNIGPDHLEFFGTLTASAESKGELLDLLPKDGAAVLNADDAFFRSLASRARCRVVSFGLTAAAQVHAEGLESDGSHGTAFRLLLPGQRRPARVSLHAHGTHNVLNALAAAAVGYCLGLSVNAIVGGLAKFRPASMRSQVQRHGRLTIINDCYNANPASMRAAIDLLVSLGKGKKTIAVLGDMLELGSSAPMLHREIGAHVARTAVSQVIACGSLGHGIADGARAAGMAAGCIHTAQDAAEAVGILADILHGDEVVLVKASRGMRLEQVVEALKQHR
jgi:UDP-N-acetylmuramoyl-tripeptide--D-alanyl-D-alanine ligase